MREPGPDEAHEETQHVRTRSKAIVKKELGAMKLASEHYSRALRESGWGQPGWVICDNVTMSGKEQLVSSALCLQKHCTGPFCLGASFTSDTKTPVWTADATRGTAEPTRAATGNPARPLTALYGKPWEITFTQDV